MTNDLALRLDWSMTNYSGKSYSEGTQYGFGGTETNTVTLDPTENLFQVGVSYQKGLRNFFTGIQLARAPWRAGRRA